MLFSVGTRISAVRCGSRGVSSAPRLRPGECELPRAIPQRFSPAPTQLVPRRATSATESRETPLVDAPVPAYSAGPLERSPGEPGAENDPIARVWARLRPKLSARVC